MLKFEFYESLERTREKTLAFQGDNVVHVHCVIYNKIQ